MCQPSYPIRVRGEVFLITPNCGSGRYEPVEITNRRRAAAARAVAKSKAAIPLFPELARWQSVEHRLTSMERRNMKFRQYWRGIQAKEIRKIRARLAQATAAEIQQLSVRWANRGGGWGIHFLLDMLWQAGYRAGR